MNKSHGIFLAATVIAVGSLTISNAATAPNRAVELEHISDNDPSEQPVPLPQPLPQGFTAPAMETFQLVGFTSGTFDGNRGALNYALACQAEFPKSRMCTAEEIRLTVAVPPAPGKGAAWVDVAPRACPQASSVPREAPESEPSNCQGWRSGANTDSAMAIDLGNAYGALGRLSCDRMLRVACCAITGP